MVSGSSGCFQRLRIIACSLSATAEFFLILAICFGPLIAFELWGVLRAERLELSTAGAVAFLVPVLWIGRARGWSFATFGFTISWKGTVGGLLLYLLAQAISSGITLLAEILHPGSDPSSFGHVAVLAILFVSIINPVFEELLETGYFIHSLQRFGMWPAVIASAAFRGLFHLQFGVNAALGVFAFGLIFALAYWRWRQLWPLIVAHSLADLLALLYGSYHAH
jgi:membrane protease YdiL (CAAX protease family)